MIFFQGGHRETTRDIGWLLERSAYGSAKAQGTNSELCGRERHERTSESVGERSETICKERVERRTHQTALT